MHYLTLLSIVMLSIITACNNSGPQEQDQATDSSAAPSRGAGITAPSAKAAGSYQGVLPCADCPGIDYQISLHADHHYRELRVYRDRNHQKAFIDTGRWQLENDSIVRLLREQPQRFLFQDGKLYHLDQEGHRITGMLADNYILRPVEGGGRGRFLGRRQ